MVAILFARRDSIYKKIPGCDVWDEDRDARKWLGGCPIIAHPPCAQWSRLRHFSHKDEEQKRLALWAVDQVRTYGGVLEHPYKSTLWNAAKLPLPGHRDPFRGYTLSMPQFWFGHPADKATWFYIVGCEPSALPPIPFRLGEAEFVVTYSHRCRRRPEMEHKQRDATPEALAFWLCELARNCDVTGA